MAIHYSINPKFDLIIYFCEGFVTASELFKILDSAALDKDYKNSGMTVIIDLSLASIDFETQDLHHVIDHAKIPGFEYGKAVVIAHDTGVHLAVNTVNLMANDIDLKLNSCNSIEDAITAIDLAGNMEEIIQFWNECRSDK